MMTGIFTRSMTFMVDTYGRHMVLDFGYFTMTVDEHFSDRDGSQRFEVTTRTFSADNPGVPTAKSHTRNLRAGAAADHLHLSYDILSVGMSTRPMIVSITVDR